MNSNYANLLIAGYENTLIAMAMSIYYGNKVLVEILISIETWHLINLLISENYCIAKMK